MIDTNIHRCLNCLEPLFKNKKLTFRFANYPGYKYDRDLCVNCNAVRFTKIKAVNGEVISREEFLMLPEVLRYDEDKPDEVAAVSWVRHCIKILEGGEKSMGNKSDEKAEKIGVWLAKGPEWLAKQLWDARKALKNIQEECKKLREENQRLAVENHSAVAIKSENRNMCRVLEDHGIFPTRLRLDVLERDCENCGYIIHDICEGPTDCGEGHFEQARHIVESVNFYSYRLDDGWIKGLTSKFEEKGLRVVKCVDEKTGDVLYSEESDTVNIQKGRADI